MVSKGKEYSGMLKTLMVDGTGGLLREEDTVIAIMGQSPKTESGIVLAYLVARNNNGTTGLLEWAYEKVEEWYPHLHSNVGVVLSSR